MQIEEEDNWKTKLSYSLYSKMQINYQFIFNY